MSDVTVLINAAQLALESAQNSINAARDALMQARKALTDNHMTVYNQRDPRWSNVKLGISQSTIGGYGCLITSVASFLVDAGTLINPAQLNAWLIENNGYTSGNLFVFNSVDRLNTVEFYIIIDCADVPAPVAQLDEYISDGWFVVVKVDFDPRTMAVEEHWVRYIGDGRMIDPWWGDVAPITPRYRGKDAAQAILKCAVYKRITP